WSTRCVSQQLAVDDQRAVGEVRGGKLVEGALASAPAHRLSSLAVVDHQLQSSGQLLDATYRNEQSIHAVTDHIATTGSLGGHDGHARCRGLQQRLRHALSMRREANDVCCAKELGHVQAIADILEVRLPGP